MVGRIDLENGLFGLVHQRVEPDALLLDVGRGHEHHVFHLVQPTLGFVNVSQTALRVGVADVGQFFKGLKDALVFAQDVEPFLLNQPLEIHAFGFRPQAVEGNGPTGKLYLCFRAGKLNLRPLAQEIWEVLFA